MLRYFLLAAAAVCLVPLTACRETVPLCEERPEDPSCECWDAGSETFDMDCQCMRDPSMPGCSVDGGGDSGDGAMDAADTAVDAGPCEMPCEGTTPLCNETLMACVQCLMDSDCTDPSAAKCGTDGMCTSCDDSAQCAGIGDTDICETAGPLAGKLCGVHRGNGSHRLRRRRGLRLARRDVQHHDAPGRHLRRLHHRPGLPGRPALRRSRLHGSQCGHLLLLGQRRSGVWRHGHGTSAVLDVVEPHERGWLDVGLLHAARAATLCVNLRHSLRSSLALRRPMT